MAHQLLRMESTTEIFHENEVEIKEIGIPQAKYDRYSVAGSEEDVEMDLASDSQNDSAVMDTQTVVETGDVLPPTSPLTEPESEEAPQEEDIIGADADADADDSSGEPELEATASHQDASAALTRKRQDSNVSGKCLFMNI